MGILTALFCHVDSAYVLQVKVEMEMEIQQYEKAKAVREEQLDRLTQICQEQAVRPISLTSPYTSHLPIYLQVYSSI